MKNSIGIRREDISRYERRVPLIPAHVRELIREYDLTFYVQPSPIRVFPDSEYLAVEFEVNHPKAPFSENESFS